MSNEFKKLTEVEVLEELSENAHVIVEDGDNMRRFPAAHTHTWESLTDKPFGTEYGDTLTWDGNTEGLVSGSGGFYRKVYDILPTVGDTAEYECTTTRNDGRTDTVTIPLWVEGMDVTEIGADAAIVYKADDYFSEPGIYLFHYGSNYCASLTIRGYGKFPAVKTIAPEYLPGVKITPVVIDFQAGTLKIGNDTYPVTFN